MGRDHHSRKWGGNGCPLDSPKIAIRQDGAVVVAAAQNRLPSLMILDGPSGSLQRKSWWT